MDNNYREQFFSTKGEASYESVLERIRTLVSSSLDISIDKLDERDLKDRIEKCITDYDIKCNITSSVMELTDYLYHDMAEYSFISREKLFEKENFEELNINSWNDVDIILDGQCYKTNYSFLSPQHSEDIHKRLLRKTNTTIDNAVPHATTDLGPSIRITVLKSPILDDDVGYASSIRKVDSRKADRESLVDKSLTDEMLRFLELGSQNGVSICFAGETGAGKTYLAGYILGQAAKKLRTFTIEEGSREWDFIERNADGKITNSVIHTKTYHSNDPNQSVTQDLLLQLALRYDPIVIALGEMRSIEAYAAMEAARTGHTVLTTTHSSNAVDTVLRIFELAKKAHDINDNLLLNMIVKAFPIIVYVEKLADGKRRVTEIVEFLGIKNGEIDYQYLWQYHVKENKYTSAQNATDGFVGTKIETIGYFKKANIISTTLSQKILRKGARSEDIQPFIDKRGDDR